MRSVSYVTCIDLIAKISLTRRPAFFLDVLILKLNITINILLTDQPK